MSTSLEAGAPAAWIDFPISVGLDESGIAAPLTMDDAGMVEKAGFGRFVVYTCHSSVCWINFKRRALH